MLIHLAPITQIDREIKMTLKPAPFPLSSGWGLGGGGGGGHVDDVKRFAW